MNYFAPMEDHAVLREESNYLAEILVATTWRCNLNCSYCFIRNHQIAHESEQMTPEIAIRIVDLLDKALVHFETICIHFYGGEPLINLPAVQAMVDRACQKKPGRFRFAITTNGYTDNPSVFKILEKGNFQIILSIDGPEKIHDQCRRTITDKPTHATVLKFLESVKEKTHCWVRGSSVVRSEWSLKNAIEYLSKLPVDAFKAQAVRAKIGSPFSLSDKEKSNYLNELEEIGKTVISEIEDGHVPKDDRFSNRVLQLLTGKKRDSFCGAGYSTFGITPDGTILPCLLMDEKEATIGHIKDNLTEWIKNGQKWRKEHNVRIECNNCSAIKLCGGGCYAITPVCGEEECEIVRKNCEVASLIYSHFKRNPEKLLVLAGIL